VRASICGSRALCGYGSVGSECDIMNRSFGFACSGLVAKSAGRR